jgi:hypothetical protein
MKILVLFLIFCCSAILGYSQDSSKAIGVISHHRRNYLFVIDGLKLMSPKTMTQMSNSYRDNEIEKSDTLQWQEAISKYGSNLGEMDGAIEISLKLPIILNNKLLFSHHNKAENLSKVKDADIERIRYLDRKKAKKQVGNDPGSGCILIKVRNQ